jgi:hypothetical protein
VVEAVRKGAISKAAAKEALESVTYDIAMTNYCRQFIRHTEERKRAASTAADIRYFELERAAFLECFLLHFRNLMEFLQHQRGDRKVHWAGELAKSKWPPPNAKRAWDHLNRPNKDAQPLMVKLSTRLAHIGKNRLVYDHVYDPDAMYAELREIFLIFRKEIREDLKDLLAPLGNDPSAPARPTSDTS